MNIAFVLLLVILFSFYFVTYRRNQIRFNLIIIILLCLVVKLYCGRDLYLHEWDERYHALVAKHLAEHPLTPTLYENPVKPYDYKLWTDNHIWLSKPPIGLWGMALSIKIFGTHEYAVRLPALIYSLLSVLLIFQMGKSLFNERTALIAALLWGTHGMLTDLASGRLSSDGIETCFLFIMNIGWYYLFKKRGQEFSMINYFVLGIIAGIAFLTKWQPSLLLLIIGYILHVKKNHFIRSSLGILLSLIITSIPVFLWYIHCRSNFPVETDYMMRAMFHPLHLNDPKNDATWYTYLTVFGNYFGYTTYLLLGWIVFTSFKTNERKWVALAAMVFIPFFIFQIAEIKRGTYLMIFAPAIFLVIGYFIQQKTYWGKIPMHVIAWISVVFIAGYSFEKLYLFSSTRQTVPEWSVRIKNANPETGALVLGEPHYIEMMFYHDVTAYP